MAAKTIKCAKLGRELPSIDETTPEGSQALRMCLLFGGAELRRRIHDQISAEAWGMWTDHMRMIMNEYRLDPTSDEAQRHPAQAHAGLLLRQRTGDPQLRPAKADGAVTPRLRRASLRRHDVHAGDDAAILVAFEQPVGEIAVGVGRP